MLTRERRLSVIALAALALAGAGCDGGNVFSLAVGDCFDDEAGADEEITSVPMVDCDEPHDNEVYHVFDLEDAADYPGDAAVQEAADEGCLDAFEPFVGTPYLDSELEYFTITPTAQSWEDADDREVICSVYELSFDKMEGTMRGVGR